MIKIEEISKEELQQLICSWSRKYSLLKKFYSLNKEILDTFPGVTYRQKIYNYLHDIKEIPTCAECNTELKFTNRFTNRI